MVIGADHDRIDIARKHARGIGDGFTTAKLHLARGHEHAVAAQLLDRHFERGSGAGRILLEYHAQRMAGERRIGVNLALGPACTRRLAVDRIVDHRRNGIRPRISEIEEMPGHASGRT